MTASLFTNKTNNMTYSKENYFEGAKVRYFLIPITEAPKWFMRANRLIVEKGEVTKTDVIEFGIDYNITILFEKK